MDMQWTTSPPTRPGFYYWQGGKLSQRQVIVAQVTAFVDKTIPLEAAELHLVIGGIVHTNAPRTGPVGSWGGRWAGPLPQPH